MSPRAVGLSAPCGTAPRARRLELGDAEAEGSLGSVVGSRDGGVGAGSPGSCSRRRTGARARWRRVPGQHLHDERPALIPPSRRMPTGTSSWCGPASARPGRTRSARASKVSATPRTDRLRARSSRSTPTRRSQYFPSVAADDDGDFVVVWQSHGSSGTDTSSYSIQGQRYASDGSAQGAQFQVNTYTTSFQRLSLRSGGCRRGLRRGVGKQRLVRDGHELLSIQGQRYASNGSTQGAQFQVNTYTTDSQLSLRGGGCRRGLRRGVEQSMARPGRTAALYSIQGQRYASTDLRWARSSRSTPTRRASVQRSLRGRRMPTGTSSWCGTATVVWDGHELPRASRASATPRTDRRRARSSRSTPTRRTTNASLRGSGCRRGLRRGVAEPRLVRDGHEQLRASRASAMPRTDRRRARSSRSTPTRRAIQQISPWRRMPTETSSWCGRAMARPGRTRVHYEHPGPTLRRPAPPGRPRFRRCPTATRFALAAALLLLGAAYALRRRS